MEDSDSPSEVQRKLENTINPCGGACACMGAAPGEPLCHCAMQSVIRYKGRWIKLSVIEPPVSPYGASLRLVSFDPNRKVQLMSALRKVSQNIGVREAKDLIEQAPSVILTDLWVSDARKFSAALEEAGAVVEIC